MLQEIAKPGLWGRQENYKMFKWNEKKKHESN